MISFFGSIVGIRVGVVYWVRYCFIVLVSSWRLLGSLMSMVLVWWLSWNQTGLSQSVCSSVVVYFSIFTWGVFGLL